MATKRMKKTILCVATRSVELFCAGSWTPKLKCEFNSQQITEEKCLQQQTEVDLNGLNRSKRR